MFAEHINPLSDAGPEQIASKFLSNLSPLPPLNKLQLHTGSSLRKRGSSQASRFALALWIDAMHENLLRTLVSSGEPLVLLSQRAILKL